MVSPTDCSWEYRLPSETPRVFPYLIYADFFFIWISLPGCVKFLLLLRPLNPLRDRKRKYRRPPATLNFPFLPTPPRLVLKM